MKSLVYLALIGCFNTALLAQDTAAVADSAPKSTVGLYRDPHKARIFGSLFPGAGHIYAGEYLRGYLYYLTTLTTVGMGVVIFSGDRCTFSLLSDASCDAGPRWPYRVLGIASVGAGIWNWISSARDASLAAQRANTRHERRTLFVKPFIEPVSEPNARLQAGLNLSW